VFEPDILNASPVIFGIGWGLAGTCPGPGIVNIIVGAWDMYSLSNQPLYCSACTFSSLAGLIFRWDFAVQVL